MFDSRTYDYRAGFEGALDRLEALTGMRVTPGSAANLTFLEWCDKLAAEGMRVDGKPFSLADRPALRAIYAAIPSTIEEARKLILVIMKSTQIGLTVLEVLAMAYFAIKFEPVNIGMFMPDQPTASFKSRHRFMRILTSAKSLYNKLITRQDADGSSRKVGEGNVLTREMGDSLLMFLWSSGKVSTESRPMDITSIDEVQEVTLDQIDKIHARAGDSHIDFRLLLSTANWPDSDIDFWYKLGTQEVWQTRCPTCDELSDLSDPAGIFPSKSIAYNTGDIAGAPPDEYCWACPQCRGWIQDPQQGTLVVTHPGRRIRSFLLPRTISPRVTAREAFEQWSRARTADQKKSFYNRFLGRPYLDPSQLPVTLAHCQACVEAGKLAGVTWKNTGRDTFMGIDQMGSFNAVIIKERLPDGRQAVIHVEAVQDDDPFERCAELMKQYGVAVCVVEQLPNANDARKFTNRFPGRAFMAGYADLKDDFMTWGDALSITDKKTRVEERSRRTVTLNQYKCMQVALYRIRDQFCLFPDPDGLVQTVFEKGVERPLALLRDWVFLHFTKTALVIVDDPELKERKPKGKVMKIGIDPHYAFANMLCDVAWARSYGTSTFMLPSSPGAPALTEHEEKVAESVRRNMPGLPVHVMKMFDRPETSKALCGNCLSYDPARGFCKDRGFNVQAIDPGCDFHVPVNES